MRIDELVTTNVLTESWLDDLIDKFANYDKKIKIVCGNVISILNKLKVEQYDIKTAKNEIYSINKYISEMYLIISKYVNNQDIVERFSFIQNFFLALASLSNQENIKQNIEKEYDKVLEILNQLPKDIKDILKGLNDEKESKASTSSNKVSYGRGFSTSSSSKVKIQPSTDKGTTSPKKEEVKKEEVPKKEVDFAKKIPIIMKKINFQYKKEHGNKMSDELYNKIYRILVDVSNN